MSYMPWLIEISLGQVPSDQVAARFQRLPEEGGDWVELWLPDLMAFLDWAQQNWPRYTYIGYIYIYIQVIYRLYI